MSNSKIQRILVVEDDTLLRNGLSDLLTHVGYKVTIAKNGAEALQVLRQADPMPNLIISDVGMEKGDGLQFFALVRTAPAWYKIPFIFLTGLSNFADVLKTRPIHRDRYMKKPFAVEELLSAVRQMLSSPQ